jgi:hypothetical protein
MATTISDVGRKRVPVRHCFVAKKRHTVNAMIYSDFSKSDRLAQGRFPAACLMAIRQLRSTLQNLKKS